MGKTIRFDPVAKEMLTSGKYKGRVVKSKKGKGSYSRKEKYNAKLVR